MVMEKAKALFESQDGSAAPTLSIADNTGILNVLVACGFAKSNGDARKLITNNGVSINNEVLKDPALVVSFAQFGGEFLLRKGKKQFINIRISE